MGEERVPLGVGRVVWEERAPLGEGRAVEGKTKAQRALVLQSCVQVWVDFLGEAGWVVSLVPPPVAD